MLLCVVSALLFGYFVYTTADRLHLETLRKKPGDFDDEIAEEVRAEEEESPAEQAREEDECQNREEQE